MYILNASCAYGKQIRLVKKDIEGEKSIRVNFQKYV